MWNFIRSISRTARAYVDLIDESMRFAAAAESNPRAYVVLVDEGSRVAVCIRPLRDGAQRELAERAA